MAQVCIGAFRSGSPEVTSGGRWHYCSTRLAPPPIRFSSVDFSHLSFPPIARSSITRSSSPKLKISVEHHLIGSVLKYSLTISGGDASFRRVRSDTPRHATSRPTHEAPGG